MPPSTALALVPEVTNDELSAIVNVLGIRDHSQAELTLFALTAKRLGLDPFAKQIYSIKRKRRDGTYSQAIQVSIDGFRSIADRTGQYAGQDEPSYGPTIGKGADSHPEFATVRVLKLIGGQIVGTASTAYWDEFAVTGYGGEMWKRMPHVMLAKCAEAQALRKAFPTQLSGVYSDEEMDQADRPTSQRTDVDRETGEITAPRQITAPRPVSPPPSVPQADVEALHAQFREEPDPDDIAAEAFAAATAPFTADELDGIAPSGGMTSSELFAAAERAGITKAQLTVAAKTMFGANRWKVTDLTDEDRAALWEEFAVPA